MCHVIRNSGCEICGQQNQSRLRGMDTMEMFRCHFSNGDYLWKREAMSRIFQSLDQILVTGKNFLPRGWGLHISGTELSPLEV